RLAVPWRPQVRALQWLIERELREWAPPRRAAGPHGLRARLTTRFWPHVDPGPTPRQALLLRRGPSRLDRGLPRTGRAVGRRRSPVPAGTALQDPPGTARKRDGSARRLAWVHVAPRAGGGRPRGQERGGRLSGRSDLGHALPPQAPSGPAPGTGRRP